MSIFRNSLILLLLFSGVAHADWVQLKNGDRISGQVINLKEGKVSIETAYAGKIVIESEQIAKIESDGKISLTLTDETTLQGSLKPAQEEGYIAVQPGEADVQTIALGDLSAFKNESLPVKIKPPFSGHASLGITSETGNTEETEMDGVTEMANVSGENRYSLDMTAEYKEASEKTTKQKAYARLQWDRFMTDVRYLYGRGVFEHDRFKDLNLRTTLGAGVGQHLLDDDQYRLLIEGGLQWVFENNSSDKDDRNFPALAWRLDYDQNLFDTDFIFFHNHSINYGLANDSNFFILARTGLRMPLIDALDLTLEHRLDWEDEPGDGNKKADQKYILSLGYGW